MKPQRLSWNSKVLFVADGRIRYWGWNNAGSLMHVLKARKVDPFAITLLCTRGFLKPSETAATNTFRDSYWFLEKAFDKPTREAIKAGKLTPNELIKILEGK